MLDRSVTALVDAEWRLRSDNKDQALVQPEADERNGPVPPAIVLTRVEPGPSPGQCGVAALETLPFMVSDPQIIFAGPDERIERESWAMVVAYRTGLLPYTSHFTWVTLADGQVVSATCVCLSPQYAVTLPIFDELVGSLQPCDEHPKDAGDRS